MSQYELTGKIKLIQDPQSFASGFTKRQFVVTTEGKYPQDVALEFVKDHCVKLDAFKEGNEVKVAFDIRGNEYNGKYYVQLSAWKIEKISDGDAREPQGARSSEYGQRETHQGGAKPPTRDNGGNEFDDSDEIPFAPNPGINYF